MPLSISEQNIPSTAHCHNETLELLANSSDAPQLSFAGCGFLCIYHAGVGAAIKEYAPHLASNRIKGSSAGAIAAAGLICDVCISQATSTILQVVTEARAGSLQALSPNFNIIGLLRTGLEQSLPPNAHILCSGRLFISATRARDYKNVIISEFDSREELIQAIICSCFIPFYCGLSAPCYRGEQYIDGGFSDNQPGKFDHGTITVSPFSGESDICPSDDESASMFGFDFYGTPIQFTTQNLFRMVVTLFPPSPEICSRICRQGFEDTLRFLTKNCMAPCVKCLTVQSNAIPVTQQQQQKEEEEEKPIRNRSIRGNKWQTEEEKRWRKTASVSRMSNLRNECNRCFEHVDRAGPPRFSSVPLPNTILKSLSEMEERNCTWMNYLRRQRIFRWWYRLLIPVILPCELMQFGVNKIRNWLSSVASTEQCLARLQSVVDFFLAQIESHQLLHSPSPHFPAGVLSVGPISSFKIASSDAPASVEPPVAFAESMGTTARKISSAVLMEQRKASVAPLDLAMPWHSLAEAKESGEEKEGEEEEEEEEEEEGKKEALQQLDEYCNRHEAILTFHYMDDTTNQLKMCQIFDAEGRNPRKDSESHAPISTTYFASDSADIASPAEHKEGGEDDSGLSLTEEEEKMPEQSRKASSSSAIPTFLAKSSSSVRRKDASAVRPFASVHPPRSFPQKLAISATAKPPLSVLRRHTFASQKASSFTANSRIPFAVATPKNGKTEEEKWPKGGERGTQNRTAEMTARRGGIPQLIRRRTTTRLPSNKAGALQGNARRGFSTDSEGAVEERDIDEQR
ncbi:hypothetical protein niasHT_010812 [Heterodera trifolii]|uniref:triacylglycerol lipase n=1 Tax=Heterodera trifolii TaxID=157864 RepID=A0ABD2KVC4_9BILA